MKPIIKKVRFRVVWAGWSSNPREITISPMGKKGWGNGPRMCRWLVGEANGEGYHTADESWDTVGRNGKGGVWTGKMADYVFTIKDLDFYTVPKKKAKPRKVKAKPKTKRRKG